MRMRAAAHHPEPAPDRCVRADEGGDRRRSLRVGGQFGSVPRRFWEEDEHIFGGISYTDLPIRQISYPSTNFNAGGKGVLLGGYTFDGPNSYEFTAMSPPRGSGARSSSGPRSIRNMARVREWRFGRLAPGPVHARVRGHWSDEARSAHYNDLCQIDGRIVLAGEHPLTFPPGRRARSCRPWTRSSACTSASSHRETARAARACADRRGGRRLGGAC